MTVTRLSEGVYRVEREGRGEIVYVAGLPGNMWAFSNGEVYQVDGTGAPGKKRPRHAGGTQALTAPMPATVAKVLVSSGVAVTKGDTIVLLEAMKMELPVRAPADGVVKAVLCSEGDLVQPDQVLVELE
jgi:biotin carboxyl carrier protein